MEAWVPLGDLPLASPQHSLPSCRTGSVAPRGPGWRGPGVGGVRVPTLRPQAWSAGLSEEQMPPGPFGTRQDPSPTPCTGAAGPSPSFRISMSDCQSPTGTGLVHQSPSHTPASEAASLRSQAPGMPVPATGTQTETHICQQRLLGLPPGWGVCTAYIAAQVPAQKHREWCRAGTGPGSRAQG